MAKLYLKLENEDGSFREYKKDKVKARWVKEAMKHSQVIDQLEKKGNAEEVLMERLRFTCDLFGNEELTPDAILDGLECNELFPTLDDIYQTVMGIGDGQEASPGK